MYGRQVKGEVTTFGTTGYTHNSVFLLYDRLTHTVWYPLNDGSFDGVGGPLLGQKIPFIEKPLIMALGAWREKYPNAEVLLGDRSELADGDPQWGAHGEWR